jgi:hypothetical protein
MAETIPGQLKAGRIEPHSFPLYPYSDVQIVTPQDSALFSNDDWICPSKYIFN